MEKFLPIFQQGVEGAKPGSNGWYNSWCPFHEAGGKEAGHSSPSFGFNPENGAWKCHGCDKSGGASDFLGELTIAGYNSDNPSDKEQAKEILADRIPGTRKPKKIDKTNKNTSSNKLPDHNQIEEWHQKLKDTPKALRHAIDDRLWSEAVIDDLKIGIVPQRGIPGYRFAIPVSTGGEISNIRKYHTECNPKVLGIRGHNECNFFPEKALDEKKIYLVEGEPDCLALRSAGLNAMTFTGGSGNVPASLHRIKDHKIVIIYDADDAGQNGARKVFQAMVKYTRQIKTLDITEIASTANDVTDAILELGSYSDFGRLLDEVEKETKIREENVVEQIVQKEVGFNEAISSGHIGVKIEITAMILGRRERPYSAVSRLSSKCDKSGSKAECTVCPLMSGKANHPVSPNDRICERDLLRQIKISDDRKRAVLRELGGFACDGWEIDEANSTIESLFEVVIGPHYDTSKGSLDKEHVGFGQRSAFAIDEGEGHAINQPYKFYGVTVAQPWDQSNTHVFTKCDEIQRAVDFFELSPEQIKKMEKFTP